MSLLGAFLFLSTLSLRRATKICLSNHLVKPTFLSTLSLRRATLLNRRFRAVHDAFLSTLSLRRATGRFGRLAVDPPHFYPRSPCGERRQQPDGTTKTTYFYPRSPCGERRRKGPRRCVLSGISIHALLAESDHSLNLPSSPIDKFLSTLSLRRATEPPCAHFAPLSISIHALLAESDVRHFMYNMGILYFYPRSPCGERHTVKLTHSTETIISIHALLAESDQIQHSFLYSL